MIRVLRHLALLALSWIAQLQTAQAEVETRYIDDQFGDSVTGALPVYLPVDQWSYGPTCSACYLEKYASLDTGDVFRGSWHETTLNPGSPQTTLSLSFTGTSIGVFCILPNAVPNTVTVAAYNFTLDGVPNGTFVHRPDSSSTILYSALVFSLSGLPNVPHTLEASPFLLDSGSSLLLFDYAQYTYETTGASPSDPILSYYPVPSSTAPSDGGGILPATVSAGGSFFASVLNPFPTFYAQTTTSAPSPSESVTHWGPIAGGTVGGLGVILGAVLALWCFRRRRRRAAISYPSTRKDQEADQEMHQHSLGANFEFLYEAADLDQHPGTQQRDVVTHSAPFVNQSVPASTKALAAFRRSVFAQGGATANNAMPSAHASAIAGDVSPPNVHAHQIAMLSTITEGGSHGALGGSEIRIPSDELARLRAESSNVQSLQAEIARLRAGAVYDEEPPPAY